MFFLVWPHFLPTISDIWLFLLKQFSTVWKFQYLLLHSCVTLAFIFSTWLVGNWDLCWACESLLLGKSRSCLHVTSKQYALTYKNSINLRFSSGVSPEPPYTFPSGNSMIRITSFSSSTVDLEASVSFGSTIISKNSLISGSKSPNLASAFRASTLWDYGCFGCYLIASLGEGAHNCNWVDLSGHYLFPSNFLKSLLWWELNHLVYHWWNCIHLVNPYSP